MVTTIIYIYIYALEIVNITYSYVIGFKYLICYIYVCMYTYIVGLYKLYKLWLKLYANFMLSEAFTFLPYKCATTKIYFISIYSLILKGIET